MSLEKKKSDPNSFRQKMFKRFESGDTPQTITQELGYKHDDKKYTAVFIYYGQWKNNKEGLVLKWVPK